MQFVLKHRVQCLQWYKTLVVSFASYPCNEHKPHVGRPKCENDTSIVRHVICKSSEYYSFTVYECQHAEVTFVFVPTSIFTFSYTTDIK